MMRRENLAYLAKLEEDPYSNAFIDEIKDRIGQATNSIDTKAFSELSQNQLYHLLGYRKALLELLDISKDARKELSILEER